MIHDDMEPIGDMYTLIYPLCIPLQVNDVCTYKPNKHIHNSNDVCTYLVARTVAPNL